MDTITTSVGGLISAVNDEVDTITSVANGILCLPYILTDGIGGLMNTAINTLASTLKSIAEGLQGLINKVVKSVINKIVGAIKKLLGKILSVFDIINSIIKKIKALVNKIKNAIFERENCKFVAASLFKCILSEAANSIKKKETAIPDITSIIDSKTQSIADKITQPGELIDRYVDKAANMASRATTAVKTLSLF
jgi:phage-related protein